MSFYLQAPHGLIQTTSKLPSPFLDNGEALDVVMNRRRAMDGTLHSYVKTTGEKNLTYTFLLDRLKALEVKEFVRVYIDEYIRLTDHNSDVWKVRLTSEPLSLTELRDGLVELQLEFIGVQLNG